MKETEGGKLDEETGPYSSSGKTGVCKCEEIGAGLGRNRLSCEQYYYERLVVHFLLFPPWTARVRQLPGCPCPLKHQGIICQTCQTCHTCRHRDIGTAEQECTFVVSDWKKLRRHRGHSPEKLSPPQHEVNPVIWARLLGTSRCDFWQQSEIVAHGLEADMIMWLNAISSLPNGCTVPLGTTPR